MYILEGNIGAGKSTFLSLLSAYVPEIEAVFEPRHYWQGSDDAQSLLSHFYTHPARWAYTMETYALMCRVKEHLKEQARKGSYTVCERSIYSGYYCFTKNGYQNGFLTEDEWYIYNQWFTFLVNKRCHEPRGFIYLRTDPDVAHERIKKRSRSSEVNINKEYVQQIHDCYDQFLIAKDAVLPTLAATPVLVLDANQEFENNGTVLAQYIDQVSAFVGLSSNRAA